jgi:hypothetical protein
MWKTIVKLQKEAPWIVEWQHSRVHPSCLLLYSPPASYGLLVERRHYQMSSHHVIISTNIRVIRMARWLERNMLRYVGRESVRVWGRCVGGQSIALLFVAKCNSFYVNACRYYYYYYYYYYIIIIIIIIILLYFDKMKVGVCDLYAVSVYPPLSSFEWQNQSLWNLVYVSWHLSPFQRRTS